MNVTREREKKTISNDNPPKRKEKEKKEKVDSSLMHFSLIYCQSRICADIKAHQAHLQDNIKQLMHRNRRECGPGA